MNDQTKICSTCNIKKPRTQFYKRSKKYREKWNCDNVHGVCKDCMRIRRRNYRRANPEKSRHETLRDNYGISITEYKTMNKAQKGLCAICGKPETWTWKGQPCGLAVDHDHDTGKVRGLLCNACNRSLGGFQHDISILASAICYLQRHSSESNSVIKTG